MSNFVEMTMGGGTILIEAAETSEIRHPREDKTKETYRGGDDTTEKTCREGEDTTEKTYRGERVLEKLDQVLDSVIQQQIVEHCKIFVGAFEQLEEASIKPKKANAEFGLQFNAEGSVYVAKIGAQSSFKISFEWEF